MLAAAPPPPLAHDHVHDPPLPPPPLLLTVAVAALARWMQRLTKMKDGSMKPELKKWLKQRLNILEQL